MGTTIIADRVICLSNNKTYLINDRIITEIDNSGNSVNVYDLSTNLLTKIKDMDYSNNSFWLATQGEGIFLFDPSLATPLKKITKGIITDNFQDLNYQNGIIWGL